MDNQTNDNTFYEWFDLPSSRWLSFRNLESVKKAMLAAAIESRNATLAMLNARIEDIQNLNADTISTGDRKNYDIKVHKFEV